MAHAFVVLLHSHHSDWSNKRLSDATAEVNLDLPCFSTAPEAGCGFSLQLRADGILKEISAEAT